MPWHTRPSDPECRRCGRRATVKLLSPRNDDYGDYCAKHGKEEAQIRNAAEKGQDRG